MSQFSHVRLPVHLYIREVPEYLRYQSEILHTSFPPEEVAHFSETPVTTIQNERQNQLIVSKTPLRSRKYLPESMPNDN